MTSLRHWWNAWRGRLLASRDPARSLRAKLEAKRQACLDALYDAETRGDTRAIGFWTMQARQATHDCLRAGGGR